MDPTKAPGCHLTLEWTEKETEDERELVGEEQTQGIHSKCQLELPRILSLYYVCM